MIQEMSIEHLMDLSNQELVELTARQDFLTPLELELMHRLEQFVAMHGDYLQEPIH
jgi:hypothetical protein